AVLFFFFQAEDGIRDFHVTGVQTCALPICPFHGGGFGEVVHTGPGGAGVAHTGHATPHVGDDIDDGATVLDHALVVHLAGHQERSEERRVGKECRCRGGPDE